MYLEASTFKKYLLSGTVPVLSYNIPSLSHKDHPSQLLGREAAGAQSIYTNRPWSHGFGGTP